ncbi:hypothetical protein INT44_007971 [Umbelopsis vinacea]|uniref:PHD-type domain-containing protein n=1 Tax=Umbelopsis vinacea TaxID=44442 RepID=A0A8H7PPB9_9FUNG|nr:hypothetical protein INT44_007971 [Umbelopsis vinacea]
MTATTEHFILQDLSDPSRTDMELTLDACMCCQSNTAQQQPGAKSFALCKQCKLDLAHTQQAYLFYTQSPIHHTLSNATISYDSMYKDVHDFVKRDVFLAPAPPAESDSDYETLSTPIMVQQEDPAFLLEEAHSLFGVDGLLSQKLHKHSTMKKNLLEDLPTPPALESEEVEAFVFCSRKRKRSEPDLVSRIDTPPTSPIFVTDPSDQLGDKRPKCDEDQSEARSPSPSAFSWSSSRRNSWSSASEDEPDQGEKPTVFEQFTEAEVDWCRYCGTTEGVNWRPGPWGKRTLCNKHGCDYKGYGFACKLPRLNLTEFEHESVNDRVIPVLQLFCSSCQEREHQGNTMRCAGCPRAFHSGCLEAGMKWTRGVWYCTNTCQENSQARRIVVDLPRKRLPLMSTPKNAKQPDQHDLVAVRQ